MDPVVGVLAVMVMLAGLLGVVIPVMPGLLVVWVTAVGTTLWIGMDAGGWAVTALLTVMFVAGTAASIWLPARQGRRGGAPGSSLVAAVLGAFVGFFLLPVVGFLIGGALGFVLAEFRRYGEWRPAFGSLARVVGAYGVGVVIELVIGLMMIGTWVVAALLRS